MFIWKFLCFCNFFITKYCIILGVSQKGQESKPNRISNSPSVIDASVNSSKKSKSVIEEDSSNFNRSSKSVNLQVSLNSSGNSTSKSPNSPFYDHGRLSLQYCKIIYILLLSCNSRARARAKRAKRAEHVLVQ